MDSVAFLEGVGVCLGLIVAIGAQNAFVLSNGLRGQHRFLVALVCAVSDALLIVIGVAGVGTLISSNPVLLAIARWGGAAFLFWYGWMAFRRAQKGGSMALDQDDGNSLRRSLMTTLAVTWLNPHVYLDTVVLLGGLAAQHAGNGRYYFGLGAILVSFVWFFCLSYGARLLAPLFTRPVAWRVLDTCVAIIMLCLAVNLMVGM